MSDLIDGELPAENAEIQAGDNGEIQAGKDGGRSEERRVRERV